MIIIEDINSLSVEQLPRSDIAIFVGKNNTGKSRILKKLRDLSGNKADYIPPSRFEVNDDIQIPANVEGTLANQKNSRTFGNFMQSGLSENPQPQTFLELIHLKDSERNKLIEWHNKYFDELIVEPKDSDNRYSSANILIDNRKARLAGSGSRSVLSLLSCLFNPDTDYVFIDEPEIGLEPRVQKNLFEFIKKISKGEDNLPKKKIVIATHSNLFLDKVDVANNWKLEKTIDGKISLYQLKNYSELLDLSYKLLGASPADLFFPENILIVEGPSDQIFLSRIIEIKYPDSKICVHFAGGICNIDNAIPAIDQMLKSLSYISLYKKAVCVLVDKVTDERIDRFIMEWKRFLEDDDSTRVISLPQEGIEYFYPRAILTELTGVADEQLDEKMNDFILATKDNQKADFGNLLQKSKVELAEDVSKKISISNIDQIDTTILSIIDKCNSLRVA